MARGPLSVEKVERLIADTNRLLGLVGGVDGVDGVDMNKPELRCVGTEGEVG